MVTSEVQRRIDLLGEQLKRSVVLNDPDVRTTHASRHYGDEDEVRIRAVLHRDAGSRVIAHVLEQGVRSWREPGRIPHAPELGLLGRFLVPVRWHGEVLGAVLVIDDDESLTASEIGRIEDFARDAASLLVAERQSADHRAMIDEHDVACWLSRDTEVRRRGMAGLGSRGLLPDLTHVRVLVAETELADPTEDAHAHVALRHAFGTVRRRIRGTSMATVRDGRGWLVIASAGALDHGQAHEAAEIVLSEIRDFLGTSRPVRIGVGAEVGAIEDAWQSCRQAELSVRAVPVLDLGPVAHWEALGALQLLMRIPDDELDATVVPAPVMALLAADAQGRLAETLDRYLRLGGVGSAAAAALHIHRTTLYYRLDRIREITGLDIDDGDVRLQLYLGLIVSRIRERRQISFQPADSMNSVRTPANDAGASKNGK